MGRRYIGVALLVKLVLVDSLLGKGSTGGCAIRIRSRMSAVVHVKRPQIFALLHLAGNRRVLANVVSPGGRLLVVLYYSFRSIDWPSPPPKPRGLGSRGGWALAGDLHSPHLYLPRC